ncbi:M20 family metallo-hydrolase [Algivirga pacifica]|uniref:M20 family metallo-hydrolase n=1 Tax=Algivirga pacifica TaxID=1162670 RepID=A0ABP9D8M2_9BACT
MNLFSEKQLIQEAIQLLKDLIAIPSLSREEDKTADLLQEFLTQKGIESTRKGNNVWAKNQHFSEEKPTYLLNSHHDTVKPNAQYTLDPFQPQVKDGKLYGLGSNDAGGPLVSLLATFLWFYGKKDLPFNLIIAMTAEEEISGREGIASIWEDLGKVDFAIVGEPTQMNLAIAEKGLMVLDCVAHGKAGHAAREEGINAIEKAMDAIHWFHTYSFMKESALLGPVKMTVTQIEAGSQHNVVPATCSFVVDVRTTDAYQNKEILELIKSCVDCEVNARSTRLNPSGVATDHPMVQAGVAIGMSTFGSVTLSDQALIPCPSVKIGPGDSARSHSADEYIYVNEIEEGIKRYIQWLGQITQ